MILTILEIAFAVFLTAKILNLIILEAPNH